MKATLLNTYTAVIEVAKFNDMEQHYMLYDIMMSIGNKEYVAKGRDIPDSLRELADTIEIDLNKGTP